MATATKKALFPKRTQRDYDWAFSVYTDLAKRYPDQWIAFSDRRVLAAGPRLGQVLEKARRHLDSPQIPHLFVETGIHVYADRS